MMGDISRIIVPLEDSYSFDMSLKDRQENKKTAIKNSDKKTSDKRSAIKKGKKDITARTEKNYNKILDFIGNGKEYKNSEIAVILGVKQAAYSRTLLNELVKENNLAAAGSNRNRVYKLTEYSSDKVKEEGANIEKQR